MENIHNKIKNRYNNAMSYLNSIEMKGKKLGKNQTNNSKKRIVTSLKKKEFDLINSNNENKKSLCNNYINYIPNKIKDKISFLVNKTKNENEFLPIKNKNSNFNPYFIYQLGEKTKNKFNDIYSLLIDDNEISNNGTSISHKLKEIKHNLNLTSSLTNLKKKNKNSLEKYSKEFQNNKKLNNNKSLIKNVNPHIDLYEKGYDIKKIKKSASYQIIEHMRKVIDCDKKGKTNRKNEKQNLTLKKLISNRINHLYNKKNNSVSFIEFDKPKCKNLFEVNKVQEHLVDLRHFNIFPKVNKRKYDKRLSLKYADNNFRILNDIKDKFFDNGLEQKIIINGKDENCNSKEEKIDFNINIRNFTRKKKTNSIDIKNIDNEKKKNEIDLTQEISIDDLM